MSADALTALLAHNAAARTQIAGLAQQASRMDAERDRGIANQRGRPFGRRSHAGQAGPWGRGRGRGRSRAHHSGGRSLSDRVAHPPSATRRGQRGGRSPSRAPPAAAPVVTAEADAVTTSAVFDPINMLVNAMRVSVLTDDAAAQKNAPVPHVAAGLANAPPVQAVPPALAAPPVQIAPLVEAAPAAADGTRWDSDDADSTLR